MLFALFFIINSFNQSHAQSIQRFSPQEGVASSKINENYLEIKNYFVQYQIQIPFELSSQGNIIQKSFFNNNLNIIESLNPSFHKTEINADIIRSEDINNHFSQFEQEINSNWKISSCVNLFESPRFIGDGFYYLDLDNNPDTPAVKVYCSNSLKTKEFYVLKNEGSYKDLDKQSSTDYLLSFAQTGITSDSEKSFSGIHNLKHNSTIIPTELYEFEGGTHSARNYCNGTPDETMCMVRFKGNTTLNGFHTTTTRKKGFVIYVDGDLTINNGSGISMTARGAKAVGQNLYLITGENVGASGGAGGIGVANNSGTHSQYLPPSHSMWNPNQGGDGINGATGGGAAGSTSNYNGLTARGGNGSAGTSYSGGSGGGAATARSCNTIAGNAEPNGGAGGSPAGCWDWVAYGGAGNNGGTIRPSNAGGGYEVNGSNGTGGLIILYVNGNLILNGTAYIESNGTASGNGGSSGAGSVNVFYTGTSTLPSGSIRANGAIGSSYRRSGNGTVRILKKSF